MRNALYGTTALVAAGALMAAPASAEEKIKLGLGGYMNMFFGVGDSDNDATVGTAGQGAGVVDRDREATNFFQDGEVWFTGETTLDNGITFGANIQLEAFSPGDQIDESFGYVEGSFGRVNLGSENSAAYLMHYAAPGVGVPINTGWISSFVPLDGVAQNSGVKTFRTPFQSTYIDNGNDERRITYFTPRFSGFQVGVSYTPTIVGTGDGTVQPALSDFEFQHGVSVGVNYVQSFNNIDIAVSGGYRRAEAPDKVITDTDPDTIVQNRNIDDPELWSAGINIGFAGFTVGGSFASQEDGTQGADGDSWDVGATYSTGPWTVGVTYLASENDDVDDTELQAFTAGVEYAVGPGITASGTLLFADAESDTGDADGVVGVLGLKYNF